MEYVNGLSISGILDKIGSLSQNSALTIIENAARGLGYAHSKRILHRDIKPANIMLSTEGGLMIVSTVGAASSSQYRQSKLQLFSSGLRSIPKDFPNRLEFTGPNIYLYFITL